MLYWLSYRNSHYLYFFFLFLPKLDFYWPIFRIQYIYHFLIYITFAIIKLQLKGIMKDYIEYLTL